MYSLNCITSFQYMIQQFIQLTKILSIDISAIQLYSRNTVLITAPYKIYLSLN